MKNFLTSTMLSLGIPMLVMGDEIRRTQHGNNNAYCHDGPLAWFDWSFVEKHADILRFVSLLLARACSATTCTNNSESASVKCFGGLRPAGMV